MEYTIVGFLMIAVCLGALLLLGKQLDSMMGGFQQNLSRHKSISEEAHSEVKAQISSRQLKESLNSHFVEMNPKEKYLLQSDLTGKLQTLGANGTTELLAKQIVVLAESLYKKGEITEEQRNTLQKLANKGHDMALVEGLVEDFVEMAGERQKELSNKTYNFEGKEYTPYELTRLVGYAGWYPNNIQDPFQDVTNGGALLVDFQRLYQEADRNGSLSNPDVKSLVTAAASQIVMTGELVEDNYSNYHNGVFNFKNKSEFTSKLASYSTHLHSSQICRSGNHIDGGTFCRKPK